MLGSVNVLGNSFGRWKLLLRLDSLFFVRRSSNFRLRERKADCFRRLSAYEIA